MQINDKIHGFIVRSVRPLEELNANLVQMEYERNGARLMWLDRNDTNMTFAIAFKTVPENHTGVFHILEHSVLNGSDKFPTKEPFVNLLKTSLQTFLNAMTFPDKTMYPVASRNKQDFLNLMDVYLDAVLHPAIYHKPEIFQQEGWHYEWTEDGSLIRNGVVFNEMKGAYASCDEMMQEHLSRVLFPDHCYGYDSGGDPAHIPELTYEQFLDAHRRFYHPSNAWIILDGDIDVDAVLGLLDSYLAPYDASDRPVPPIAIQPPVPYQEKTISYEIAPGEDPAGKGHLTIGYVMGTYADRAQNLAMEILRDVLFGSNEAPMKKAILEKGLGQDVRLDLNCCQQMSVYLTVKNTDEDKVQPIKETIRGVVENLAKEGIDRTQLTAAINHMEFSARERDYYGWPTGLVFAMDAMDSWLYGGDPAQNLCFDETYAFLRSQLSTDYFEKLLTALFLECPHSAQIYAAPSTTCGEEARQKDAAELAKLADSWDQAQKDEIARKAQTLRQLQQTPDSPEDVAKLPMLSLSEVSDTPELLPLDTETVLGRPVLASQVDTNGIRYIDLYFSAADLPLNDLPQAALLASVLGKIGTEKHSGLALQSALKTNLGAFNCSVEVMSPAGKADACTVYFLVSASMLESKTTEAVALIHEVLTQTLFTDHQAISNILRQNKLMLRQRIMMSGNRFGATRAASGFSAAGTAREAISGLDSYRWLCEADASFSGSLCDQLEALYKKLLTQSRLTLGLTGQKDLSLAQALIAGLREGTPVTSAAVYTPAGARREGFVIPAEISFAAQGANLYALGLPRTGQMQVVASCLSLDYLWNKVRVQGGAYGCGMSTNGAGDAYFTTYRDPSAANSLRCFAEAGEYLRTAPLTQEDVNGLILGTISETDPLRSPRMKGKQAAVNYLSGKTNEDMIRFHREILSTTVADFTAISHQLDTVCSQNAICVIGSKAILDTCADKLDTVAALSE